MSQISPNGNGSFGPSNGNGHRSPQNPTSELTAPTSPYADTATFIPPGTREGIATDSAADLNLSRLCIFPNQDTERTALANLLRCRNCRWHSLGSTGPPDIASAISTPAAQAVFDAAQHLYDRDQRLPEDADVLRVEVEHYLREIDNWDNAAAEPLAELISWCYSPAAGAISEGRGRELWIALIREHVLAPMMQNAAINVRTSPACHNHCYGGP